MKSKFAIMLKNNVKVERESRKITQTELAKYLRVSRQTVSSIEKGEYNPTLYLTLKLSRILHQPVEYLFQIK